MWVYGICCISGQLDPRESGKSRIYELWVPILLIGYDYFKMVLLLRFSCWTHNFKVWLFQMVNSRRTRNLGCRNNTQENEMLDHHNERMETSPENPPSERNQRESNLMDQMEQVLGSMVTLMQGTRMTGQVIPQNCNVNDRFQRLNPPIFRGRAGVDPCENEYWLEHIKKIFDFIRCEEVDKVGCATFMLWDEADQWWKTMQRTLQDPER